jgi:heat shock protein HslJ
MTSITPAAAGGLLLLILSACAQPEAADRGNVETSDLSLAKTSWTVERLGEDSGPALQELTLIFAENGRVSGHDGCNAFSGDATVKNFTIRNGYRAAYKVEGRTILIQPPGSTRCACVEPAGVM